MKHQMQIDIELSTDKLAEMFINSGSDEQAEFINLIGAHFKKADFNAEIQCSYLVDDINKDGKDFIFTLANFLKVQKIPSDSPKITTLLNSYDGESL